MTNYEAVERFDQAHGAKIEKMFWIAGSLENSELKDLLNDMDDDAFRSCFPDIFNNEYFEEYKEEDSLVQALVDERKFGILVEILIPVCDNFSFKKNGEFQSCSVHGGHSVIEYAYSETLEDLLIQIEKVSEKTFNGFIEKEKKKKAVA